LKRSRAVQLLRTELEGGPKEVRAIREKAESLGISWRTVEKAKEELQIKSTRKGRTSVWSLGELSPAVAA
jgi:hypothetical protein